jgi:hypothetical protein
MFVPSPLEQLRQERFADRFNAPAWLRVGLEDDRAARNATAATIQSFGCIVLKKSTFVLPVSVLLM